jgi:hypothetical protein
MASTADRSPREALAEELRETAIATAQAHGRTFESGASQEMRDMLYRAAGTILKYPSSNRQGAIADAHANLRTFVDTMAEEAVRLRSQGYPSNVLGEKTFAAARVRLCPLPPFC